MVTCYCCHLKGRFRDLLWLLPLEQWAMARYSLKLYRELTQSFHQWCLLRISCTGIIQFLEAQCIVSTTEASTKLSVSRASNSGQSSLKGFPISEMVLKRLLTWLWKGFFVQSSCSWCLFFSSMLVSPFNWISNSGTLQWFLVWPPSIF